MFLFEIVFILIFQTIQTRLEHIDYWFTIQLPINNLRLNQSQLIYFNHSQSSSYSNLILKDQYLYLTGTDFVFKLNSNQINKQDIDYKERSLKPTNKNNISHFKNHNFIKFLSPRDLTNDLIVCGTNLGKPHIYDLKESDLTNQLEYNGDYLCAGVDDLNSLNLIDLRGVSKYGVMYSGIWITELPSQAYGIFSRYGLFRKEIEINRHFLRSLFSPYWLWEPDFIQIMQDEKYVYYFFTEISIEHFSFKHPKFDLSSLNVLSNYTQSNDLVRFSRVARVCRNDRGSNSEKEPNLNDMWTTFRKISLECNCNKNLTNSTYFEHKTFTMNFKNLKLIKRNHLNKLYGIFHEALLDLNTGRMKTFSILCEYDFDQMRQRLESKQFWFNKNYKDESGDENPIETDFDCNDSDESGDLRDNLKFLSENTILNTNLEGLCRLVLPNRVTALTIDKMNSHDSLFYLGTSDSKIIRAHQTDSSVKLLSILDLSNNSACSSSVDENIIEILINDKQAYVSTPHCVYQMNLNNLNEKVCNNYLSCVDCNLDSECFWSLNICSLKKSNLDITNNCTNRTIKNIDIKVKPNGTLILNCVEAIGLKSVNQIKWINNGIEIENGLNRRVSQLGELILLNIIRNDSFICQLNHVFNTISFNIEIENLNRQEMSTTSLIPINDSVKLVNMFTDWKNKIEKVQFELQENIFNCSAECKC